MSGLIVSFAPWAARANQLTGFDRAFTTLPEPRRATRLDARLNVASATDVTVTVTDSALNSVTLTIPGGEDHASLAVDLEFAAGELTVRTDGSDSSGEGFSGNLWLADVGGAPSAASTLVSLSDLLDALGNPATNPDEDAWLQRKLEVFSERIRDYCNRHFNRRRYTETHYSPDVVVLREAPVQTIHEAQDGGSDLDVAELRVQAMTGLVSPPSNDTSSRWLRYGDVWFDYEAGYDTCPAGVADLIYQGIGKLWAEYSDGELNPEAPALVKRETIAGAGTVEYDRSSSGAMNTTADYALGFPMSSLDPWVRTTQIGVADTDMFWELA